MQGLNLILIIRFKIYSKAVYNFSVVYYFGTLFIDVLAKWKKSFRCNKRKGKESEVVQSCPTLCDPIDCCLPGSSVHGIFQARVLEWVAISFSRGSSQPRDRTWISHIAGRHILPSEPQGSPGTTKALVIYREGQIWNQTTETYRKMNLWVVIELIDYFSVNR